MAPSVKFIDLFGLSYEVFSFINLATYDFYSWIILS